MGSGTSKSDTSTDRKSYCNGPFLPLEPDTGVRSARTFLAKSSLAVDTGTITHWALAFQFKDFWITIDGQNYNGNLVARYFKSDVAPKAKLILLPKCVLPNKIFERSSVKLWADTIKRKFVPGSLDLKLSPQQIRTIAENNPHNAVAFEIGSMDSKTWVKNAAEQIQKISNSNFYRNSIC